MFLKQRKRRLPPGQKVYGYIEFVPVDPLIIKQFGYNPLSISLFYRTIFVFVLLILLPMSCMYMGQYRTIFTKPAGVVTYIETNPQNLILTLENRSEIIDYIMKDSVHTNFKTDEILFYVVKSVGGMFLCRENEKDCEPLKNTKIIARKNAPDPHSVYLKNMEEKREQLRQIKQNSNQQQ